MFSFRYPLDLFRSSPKLSESEIRDRAESTLSQDWALILILSIGVFIFSPPHIGAVLMLGFIISFARNILINQIKKNPKEYE